VVCPLRDSRPIDSMEVEARPRHAVCMVCDFFYPSMGVSVVLFFVVDTILYQTNAFSKVSWALRGSIFQ
jgi:uncharacterized membrane protein